MAAIWIYATAMDTGSRKRFLVAGLFVGLATIFKHVGGYLIPVVLLHWLIVRKHNRQHLELFGIVVGVLALYVVGMALVFGHDYWREAAVQFERTFGSHDDRGTVNSLSSLIKPMIQRYYIFYATIPLALSGVAIVVIRAFQVVRHRSFDVVRQDSLLFAWAAASLLSFGAINLKFPQYSVLVLVPLYMYGSVEAD